MKTHTPAFPLEVRTGEAPLFADGALALAKAATVDAAAAVAHAAAVAWWAVVVEKAGGDAKRIPAPPLACPTADLSPVRLDDARHLGRTFAARPMAVAAAALGTLYAQALPGPHRAANGVFYSPLPLVRRLLDNAEAAGHDWSRHRAIDPSCGGGAFLVEAAARMAAALEEADAAIVLSSMSTRLRGWDTDPFAVWLANLSVEALMLPLVVRSGRRLAPVAEVRDALADLQHARGEWHLAMGNPPFGKVKDTVEIRARFRRSLYGHPNLYGLFTDLAVHLVAPQGGIVAYLTPASYLAGNYFKSLRRLLHERARPLSIDLVESRNDVFKDVLQEVALSVFQAGRTEAHAACAVMRVTPAGMEIEAAGTLILPADAEAPWTLPRGPDDAHLVERLHRMPHRLADWGYQVSTGPLVWNRHKPRLLDTPKVGCVAVVWAEAVTQDGRFVLRATKRNHRPWYQPRAADDPNVVDRPCVLVQRTTAKEQARRLISAEMSAGFLAGCGGRAAVENHLNMVRPMTGTPRVPLAGLARFLGTETADRVFRCINASVAVSATELSAMPLPSSEEIVAAMAEADPEAAVRRLYGLGA